MVPFINFSSVHNPLKQAEIDAYLADVEKHNGTGTSKKRKNTDEEYQPRYETNPNFFCLGLTENI